MDIELPEGNLIVLSRHRIARGKCRHIRLLVDEDRAYVECQDCGEMLNPMAILCRFAREESRYIYQARALRNWRIKLQEKSRTKCEHCGRMTPVNIKMTSAEEQGFKDAT